MEAPPDLQIGPELFNAVHLVSPRTGKPVLLSALVKVDTRKTRSLIDRASGAVPGFNDFWLNQPPGVSLGVGMAAVGRRAAIGG